MKKETIVSWMLIVMGLLISLIYFFLFSYDRVMVLGGGTISLLLMPFVGFLSLIVKKFMRLFVLIFVFLCGHVAMNHLIASSFSANTHINPFIAIYLGVWSSAFEIWPLLHLSYVLLKPINHISQRLISSYQSIRFFPLTITVFAISYGVLIERLLSDYFRYQFPLMNFLFAFMICYSLVVIGSCFLFWHFASGIVEFLVTHERFRNVQKVNVIFVLFLISFTLLSAMAESARGYWLFWSLNTFAIIAALVGQWKFIRVLFLEHNEVEQEPRVFYFPQIWSRRFLVWNLAVYFVVMAVLVFI